MSEIKNNNENTNKLQKDNEYEEEKEIVLNAFALVGFILGLLSTVLYWVLAIVPILAIIFSIIGIVGTEKAKQKGKGIAIAGLILGILYTCVFGLQIFLKDNNYFQDNNTSNIQKTITKDDFIGTWEKISTVENSKFVTRYYIRDYTYTYEFILYYNDVMSEWFTNSGTIQYMGDKLLATKTDYTNMLNAPTDYWGTTYFEIEYDYLIKDFIKVK